MKKLFIHAKSTINIARVLKKFKFEGKIGVVSSIQYLDQIKKLKNKNFIIGGQILGCNIANALRIKDKVDCFLFIGSGEFHGLGLAYKTKKPVYIANPLTNIINKISEKDVRDYERRLKGKKSKFLMANNIGILISTKPGQYSPGKYLKLKEKMKVVGFLKKKYNKKFYVFVCNNVNPEDLENFNDIDMWVNTACPRIEMKNVINLEDLLK